LKTFIAKDIVEMVQRAAAKEAGEGTTGWACIGSISCAHYPLSRTYNWFIDNKVANKRDVINWLSKQLLPTVYVPSKQLA